MNVSAKRLRRSLGSILFVAALGLAAFAFRHPLSRWFDRDSAPQATPSRAAATSPSTLAGSAASAPADGAVDHYTCSMHPSVHQQTPGKCPICGMDLIP